MKLCPVCQKETTNPKYCSLSCSAIQNNKNMPKRKKKPRFCVKCEAPVENRKKKYCSSCSRQNWKNVTLENYEYKTVWHKHAKIRGLARSVADKYLKEKKCFVCGYSLHTQVCHKKPVAKFALDDKISDVNAPENLVRLCPNHHWEFDRGLIQIPSSICN